MKVSIIGGTGYVGLVTGVGLAACSNDVICADINEKKIEDLNNDILPIYEKGLDELLKRAKSEKRISFTNCIATAVAESEMIIIAVGTPENRYGDTDLSQLVKAVKSIAACMTGYKTIVIKSTVPVGTCDLAAGLLKENLKHPSASFDMVSNPEFLREGNAVNDFMFPERIVIGAENQEAAEKVKKLYDSFNAPVLLCDIRSSEMAKYACNSYLASRISFINEIAEICESVGADISPVLNAMKLDRRIGGEYLSPGPGFGGPCLTKDLRSLINFAERADANVDLLRAVFNRNELQIDKIINDIFDVPDEYKIDKVAVLGLSFKAGTGDTRNSPAIQLIEKLVGSGIKISAYDPAVKEIDTGFDYCVSMAGSVEEAVCGSDCLVIMTDWEEFKRIDLQRIKNIMRTPSIVDARNIIPVRTAVEQGLRYKGIGISGKVWLEQNTEADLNNVTGPHWKLKHIV